MLPSSCTLARHYASLDAPLLPPTFSESAHGIGLSFRNFCLRLPRRSRLSHRVGVTLRRSEASQTHRLIGPNSPAIGRRNVARWRWHATHFFERRVLRATSAFRPAPHATHSLRQRRKDPPDGDGGVPRRPPEPISILHRISRRDEPRWRSFFPFARASTEFHQMGGSSSRRDWI